MRKYIFTLINVIAAFFAIAALAFINLTFPDGNIISIINSPVYEKTEDFYNQVNNNISDIFTYINYKSAFENNDELNYGMIIAESIDKNGGFKKWSVGDCIENAKLHGLYIDTDNVVKIANDKSYLPFNKKDTLNFMLKTYPSPVRNGTTSEEDFIYEVMHALATYNRCKIQYTANSNFNYRLTFTDNTTGKQTIYKNNDFKNTDFLSSNAFIYISSEDSIISSNINYVSSDIIKSIDIVNPHPNQSYTLYCSINTAYPYTDNYKIAYEAYNSIKNNCGTLVSVSIIALIIFIATLFAALYYILSAEKKVHESQKFFYALPTELHIIFYIIANIIFIQVFTILIDNNFLSKDLSSIKSYFYIFVVYSTTIVFFTILSSKYTDDTLTPSLLRLNKDISDDSFHSISPFLSFLLVFLPIIIFIILSFYVIYLYTAIGNRLLLTVGILLLISTIGFIVYLLTLYNAFNKTLKSQADANNMRTSLITNVTHDIKTPLTSILSYTDLIAEETKNPSRSFKKNIAHYSKIVNDKSRHLNELINDLIFDSKVSTGNLKLEFQKIDLVSFLTQVDAEFKDRLMTKGLKVIFSHDVKSALINADSNQLYRVFQNLFSNIYKYALDKSRVYMDLITTKSRVKIVIKNIQKEKLDVNVNSLKDRFVRGSASRNTEGFGLGLSIAENLIKSMNGKLNISNVRDEFITTITFLLYEE